MHNVYRRPMGGYTFKWDGKAWSFDQLSEVLSTVVSAQGMPGGYMNKGAALRVCDEETNPSVNNHPIYGLTLHLLKKHGCNLNTLHEESGKALQAFMDTAPRF